MIDFQGLSALHEHHGHEVKAAVDSAIRTGTLIDGPQVRELEIYCAEVLGRKYAIGTGSGTDALAIALRACGIGPGDEVIVTSYSFIASASPVVLIGATPVYVPVCPETLHPTAKAIATACTPATKAIIAVHLFGGCTPEIVEISEFAARRDIRLIEDAAQAFGTKHHGKRAGTFGDIATFSFDPSKVFGGITSGGLIATDDPEIHHRSVAMRSHGYDVSTGEFQMLGLNSRMSTANAAVLLALSRYQDTWRERRADIACQYDSALANLPITRSATPAAIVNFHKYVLQYHQRDALRAHLRGFGIPTKVHYHRALPDHPALAGHGRIHGALDCSRMAAQQSLSLPIHPFMTASQVLKVTTVVRSGPW